MTDRWQFVLNRLRERLWVKPLAVCLVSIGGVFLAHLADGTGLGRLVPEITPESIEALLKIIAASMLVIATFAVASMVAAYASASSSATPRSFALIVADDTSQNALSTFIGVFIFSVVALVALMNGFYGKAGRFTLFALTVLVFAIVIVTFLRWVDTIARLGRLGNTITKVEAATATAFDQRRAAPYLGGRAARSPVSGGQVVHGEAIGYLQRLDVAALQARAEQAGFHVALAALPGATWKPACSARACRGGDVEPGWEDSRWAWPWHRLGRHSPGDLGGSAAEGEGAARRWESKAVAVATSFGDGIPQPPQPGDGVHPAGER